MASSYSPQVHMILDYDAFMQNGLQTPVEIFTSAYSTQNDGNFESIAVMASMRHQYLSVPLKNRIMELIYEEWECSYCRDNCQRLLKFVDKDHKPLLCANYAVSSNPLHEEIYKTLCDLVRDYKQTTKGVIWDFIIIDSDLTGTTRSTDGNIIEDILFTKSSVFGRCRKTKEKFVHYAYTPSVTCYITSNNAMIMSKAFQKYFARIYELYKNFPIDTDMIDSLKTLLGLLDVATYGSTQKFAVQWLHDNILAIYERYNTTWDNLSPTIKMQCVIDTIGKSSKGEGEKDQSYIGSYHTIIGFISDILENATSMKAAVRLIEARNDPSTYRRKTAAPKAVHIAAAEALCTDFENTIHTVEELEELGAVCCIAERASGGGGAAAGAFASMKADISKKNKYSSFNKRCSVAPRPTTLKELMKMVERGEIYNIKVDSSSGSNVYTSKTTMDRSDMCVEHPWLFLNNESKTDRWSSFSRWLPVSHIYNIKSSKRNNFHFIVKNARQTLARYPIKGNCTLPEFLAPKHRVAESAFAKLEKLTTISVPPYGQISLGKGFSRKRDNGDLHVDAILLINNTNTLTIKKSG